VPNNPEFLDLYNRLDNLCRERFSLDDRSESAIMLYVNELRRSYSNKDHDLAESLDSIRQLRNALVHTEKVEGQELVEINPLLISILKSTILTLSNPPKAMSKAIPFSSLFVVSLTDEVSFVLSKMMEKGFSHVPVVDNKGHLIGVFSENALCSYLEDKHTITLSKDLTIEVLADYLPINKHENERYALYARNALLSDVAEDFMSSKRKTGKRLGMVFLTETGKLDEKIIAALVLTSLEQ